MLKLAVSGATGRMGRILGRLIGDADDLAAVGGIARTEGDHGAEAAGSYPEVTPVERAGSLIRRADALIDFSAPEQLAALLEHHAGALEGCAVLVGTTGLTDDIEVRLSSLAERTPVLVAANFSVGVNLLLGLVRQAARALPEGGYDIEIVEAHHRRKEDAPSGTALALGEAAAEGRGSDLDDVRQDGRSGRTGTRPGSQIGFHALRGGDIVGDHDVLFLGERERVSLGHRALSRELFAEGALVAARWVAGQGPGRYGMADVLGIEDR